MHRRGKEGLGAAYLAGFDWALERRATTSSSRWTPTARTSPSSCPACSTALRDADLVLGSRWVPGGSVVNWPKSREVLSRGGSLYTRLMLGVPMKDATGGYRAFRADTLRTLDLTGVESAGYCFQVELGWRAVQAGLRVREVPIEFVERELGDSKMDQKIVAEALWRVTVWGAQDKTQQGQAPARRRTTSDGPRRLVTMGPWVILGVVVYVVLEWFVASWLASIIGWRGVFLTVADPRDRRRRRHAPRRLRRRPVAAPGAASTASRCSRR